MELAYDKDIEKLQRQISRLQGVLYLFETDVADIGETGKTNIPIILTNKVTTLKQIKKELEDKQKPISTNLAI